MFEIKLNGKLVVCVFHALENTHIPIMSAMETKSSGHAQPGGFSHLGVREHLNVAPFPVREPVTCEVVVNADLRSQMIYEDDEKRRGDVGEDLFAKVARRLGIEVEYSNGKQDFESHIDFILEWPDETRKTVDVKGRKKIQRSDADIAFETAGRGEELVWLELHGAHERGKGWLSGGKADLIAFETETQFVFFHREGLNKAVRSQGSFIDFSCQVDSAKDAENKIFHRGEVLGNGNHDEVTIVSLGRLQREFSSTVFCVWEKEE